MRSIRRAGSCKVICAANYCVFVVPKSTKVLLLAWPTRLTISIVILEAYMKQLCIFNLWIYYRNCYPQCGMNSCILVSSLRSSQMKREKRSPKKHFILIKTWNNSRHNSEHSKGCSSSCWLHKSQRTVWTGFSLVRSASSSCWHGLSPECASEIGGGSKSRWH